VSLPTSEAAWPGRRPQIGLIFTVTLTGILANTLIAPLIPDILADFDQPDSRAGILVASGSLPGVLAAPLIGVLADRHGRRAVLVPCLAVFGVFGLLAAAAPTFGVLIGARLAMGLGSAGLINLAIVLIGDHWEGEDRIRQVGRNAAVITVGLATIPLVSGILAEVFSWRASLALYSLALITAVVAHLELDSVLPPHASIKLSDQLRGAAVALRDPTIVTTILSGFLIFVMIFGLFLTALPVHLEEEFGLESAARGAMLAVPAVTSFFVAINLARLRRRFGLRAVIITSTALFVVSPMLVGWAPTLVIAVIALAIYGLAEGGAVPTFQEVAVSASSSEQRGAVLAVWVAFVRLGQSVGPLVFAPLFAGIGTSAALIVGGFVAVPVLLLQVFGPIGREPR
jgi:ACDE family multidrug resistance protein